MPVTYAGVDICFPDQAALDRIEATVSLEDCFAFANKSWLGAVSWKSPTSGMDQSVKLNRFFYPRGASRFGRCHVCMTTNQVDAVRAYLDENGGEADLFLSDGTRSITTAMHMLPARPLSASIGEDLWLVTLVDDRFYYWLTKSDLSSTYDTWDEIIDAVGVAMGTTAIDHRDVPFGYWGGPSGDLFFYSGEYPALLLDQIGYCIQQRFIRRLDGSVFFQSATFDEVTPSGEITRISSQTQCEQNQAAAIPMGGGRFAMDPDESNDLIRLVPETVRTYFPVFRDGKPTSEIYAVQTSLEDLLPVASAGDDLLEAYGLHGGGFAGDKLVHSTTIASFTGAADTPDNFDDLQAIVTHWATEWWLWQIPWSDQAFPGIAEWEPEGNHDIEWIFEGGKFATRIQPGPQLDIATRLTNTSSDGSAGGDASPIYDNLYVTNNLTIAGGLSLSNTNLTVNNFTTTGAAYFGGNITIVGALVLTGTNLTVNNFTSSGTGWFGGILNIVGCLKAHDCFEFYSGSTKIYDIQNSTLKTSWYDTTTGTTNIAIVPGTSGSNIPQSIKFTNTTGTTIMQMTGGGGGGGGGTPNGAGILYLYPPGGGRGIVLDGGGGGGGGPNGTPLITIPGYANAGITADGGNQAIGSFLTFQTPTGNITGRMGGGIGNTTPFITLTGDTGLAIADIRNTGISTTAIAGYNTTLPITAIGNATVPGILKVGPNTTLALQNAVTTTPPSGFSTAYPDANGTALYMKNSSGTSTLIGPIGGNGSLPSPTVTGQVPYSNTNSTYGLTIDPGTTDYELLEWNYTNGTWRPRKLTDFLDEIVGTSSGNAGALLVRTTLNGWKIVPSNGNNGGALRWDNTQDESAAWVNQGVAVADSTGPDVVAQLNALLASLRTSKAIAT